MPVGKVKKWLDERGFGFIKPDEGGDDIFFHITATPDQAGVNQGQAVRYEIGTDERTGKTRAVNVNPA
jgi:CspA family cold shock protein